MKNNVPMTAFDLRRQLRRIGTPDEERPEVFCNSHRSYCNRQIWVVFHEPSFLAPELL